MFNLFQTASDDQTAIGACLLTLAGAAFFVFVSFHLGPAGQKQRNRERKNLNASTDSQTQMPSQDTHERAA